MVTTARYREEIGGRGTPVSRSAFHLIIGRIGLEAELFLRPSASSVDYRWEEMERFDPTREIEMSARATHALDQEGRAAQVELLRRVVEAKRRGRTRNLDLLFARIDSVLRSA